MKIRVIKKKLSNPRVRRRLKIGLSVFGSAIIMVILVKVVYDIGFFDAQALKNANNTALPHTDDPVLTMESAQQIVSGALKEDFNNPRTIVKMIVNNDNKLSTVIIENDKEKKIAWIINMRLFFTGDLYNDERINLTEAIERQHNDAFAR